MRGIVQGWDPTEALLTRGQLVRRSLQAGAGIGLLGVLGAACGGDEQEAGTTGKTPTATAAAELSGTVNMMNYPGWIGENEYASFHELNPEVTIKEIAAPTGSIAARAAQVQQNPSAYDMLLADTSLVGQLLESDLVEEIDLRQIPNIKYVGEKFRSDYPRGIPTDFGKVGIGYRTDLVSEEITSWANLWELAPKYSGKIVFAGLDRDCMGSVAKYLGYSCNTQDAGELDGIKQALLEIKPHLQALLEVDVSKPLVQGSAVMNMSWDYDIALAQQDEPKIAWVAPEEGMTAYLDGWIAVKGTDQLDEVLAFMDFHLDPKNYADFINTVGSAYVESEATQFIDESIAKNPVLSFDEAVIEKVEFQQFLGEATAAWSRIWDEVKSA